MKINATAPNTASAAQRSDASQPLSKTAYKELMSNISNKIGDGGPVSHLKLAEGRNGRVAFKGEMFLGPGGGTVHFSGQADKNGKIVTYRTGEPQ
jgi:hypothetical protein